MTVPKIFFCGDPHGQFKQILRAAKEHKPDAIILLGDNLGEEDSARPLSQELKDIWHMTWFIHGNHETDHESTARLMQQDADKNLHGRVVDIAGLRVAGLGGVFRENIWMPGYSDPFYRDYAHYKQVADFKRPPRIRHETHGEDRKHFSSIFADDYDALGAQEADVLVTHEACSPHPHGYAVLDDLAQALGARWHFHGHHHDCLDYSEHWERLGFVTRGVGLRGITDLQGNLIVPGQKG